jgi:hypothetical protein
VTLIYRIQPLLVQGSSDSCWRRLGVERGELVDGYGTRAREERRFKQLR